MGDCSSGGNAYRQMLRGWDAISQSHSGSMVYKPIGSFTFISLKHVASFFLIITRIVSDIDNLRSQDALSSLIA